MQRKLFYICIDKTISVETNKYKISDKHILIARRCGVYSVENALFFTIGYTNNASAIYSIYSLN